MKELTEQITKALIELKQASISIKDDPKVMMHKYNVLFVGEKFNATTGMDIHASLKEYFGIELSNKKLNELLPAICASLDMTYEPLKELSDINNPVPATYLVTLWK